MLLLTTRDRPFPWNHCSGPHSGLGLGRRDWGPCPVHTIRWLRPSIHVRFSLSFSGGEGGEGPPHPRRKDVGMETHPERQCLVFPKGEVEGQAGFLVSLCSPA